jgi:hypothetical protein
MRENLELASDSMLRIRIYCSTVDVYKLITGEIDFILPSESSLAYRSSNINERIIYIKYKYLLMHSHIHAVVQPCLEFRIQVLIPQYIRFDIILVISFYIK